MTDYKVTDTQLTSIANAIRAKTGKSTQIEFPNEFVSEIGSISGGGGSANILSGIVVPTASVGSDGDVYLHYYGFAGYTIVEYLGVESAGAYIDTGVANASNAYFEVECNWMSALSNNNSIFGAQTTVEYSINSYNGVAFIVAGYNHANISTPLVRHKLKADATKIYIDNVDTGISPNWSSTTGRNYYIFANNYSGGVLKASNAKVYSAKIWNGDNLVRYFIPVKRNSDDVLGLYDLENNVFYTNAGTGSFVAGEEITDTDYDTIHGVYCKVNGVWQDLIGSDIDDVNIGN